MSRVLTYAKDTPRVELRPGKSQRILVETDALIVEEIFFDTGISSEPHAHSEEQAAYHVAGDFEIDLGGETLRAGPGDGYSIPANAPHSVRCLSAGSYILTSALAQSASAAGHDHGH